MNSPNQFPAHASDKVQQETERQGSPLSLNRLREAFAQMLGSGSDEGIASSADACPPSTMEMKRASHRLPTDHACEVSPRSVVEAMLFIGRPDNASTSARELAAAMRGVSPTEIEAAVAELNALYDEDAAPYHIEIGNAGYRLVLRHDFDRMRDKFYGRVREAKLSTAAVEVLSIVAYNQPVTAEEIDQLRSAPSGGALSTLVRRKLVRLERPCDDTPPQYWTTDRFLRLFGLDDLAALPRSEELDKA